MASGANTYAPPPAGTTPSANDPLSPFDEWIEKELNYQAPPLPQSAKILPQVGNLAAGLVQQLGIYGQDPVYRPYIPNPTDVNQAFQHLDKESLLDTTRNYSAGRQRSMAEYMQRAGGDSYDISAGLAGPLADATRQVSQQAQSIDMFNQGQDRGKAQFNIGVGQGVHQAEEMTRTERNRQLAQSTMGTKETFANSYDIWRQTQELEQARQLMETQRQGQAGQFAMMRDFLKEMYT